METQTLSPTAKHAVYFKKFIRSLVDKFQPLQIFCIAKSTSSNELDSCFTKRKAENTCNYCLLIITESPTRIDHEVQEFCNCHYHHGNITIICHGQETIAEAIKANNRFFNTVCNTGQLIYSHDGINNFNAYNQFIPTQSAVKAHKHLSHHIPLAEGFLNGAAECLSKEQFNVCVFMLHQVVEQCLITLIRVHLAYRSDIHNLKRMLGLCQAFSNEPTKLLLSGSPQDKKLFDVLTKSYSSARYTSSFSVNKEDAKELYKRVSAFFILTQTMCKDKIKQLDIEAVSYQELHGEQETADHQLTDISI